MAGYKVFARIVRPSDESLQLIVVRPTWPDIAAWCRALESVVGESEGLKFFYSIEALADEEGSDVS